MRKVSERRTIRQLLADLVVDWALTEVDALDAGHRFFSALQTVFHLNRVANKCDMRAQTVIGRGSTQCRYGRGTGLMQGRLPQGGDQVVRSYDDCAEDYVPDQ